MGGGLSGARLPGDHRYVHFDLPGGTTEQLQFVPGIKLRSARDLYPGSKVRPMTDNEVEQYIAKRAAKRRLEREC